ncbi:hypothetical protein [Pseudonocardia pini]|uniref:hypothetical protein n=1 Tax=Pseudonocardia pini TaxID=2758030 RepID=UPI0015F042E0|nr:hypothetical protein [Pseudonocardia pini]
MTTTPHHEPAAARFDLPAGLATPFPGPGDPWTGLPGLQFPAIPDQRTPEYARAQPYLTFPTSRAPQPGGVLATRVVGLVTTILAALWPAFFALMALAFGLGLNSAAGVVFGVFLAVLAIGWPLGFWFATGRARRVWPVLLALVPTAMVAAWTVYVLTLN